jgi:hypothetical protein
VAVIPHPNKADIHNKEDIPNREAIPNKAVMQNSLALPPGARMVGAVDSLVEDRSLSVSKSWETSRFRQDLFMAICTFKNPDHLASLTKTQMRRFSRRLPSHPRSERSLHPPPSRPARWRIRRDCRGCSRIPPWMHQSVGPPANMVRHCVARHLFRRNLQPIPRRQGILGLPRC